MKPPEPFELSPMERQSPLWRRLEDLFDERLAGLRAQLEGNQSEVDTAHLRGRIAQLKALKALGEEPPIR